MRTLGFTATFGCNEGYYHDNQGSISLEAFGTLWQTHMQKIFDETEILVGCVIHKSKAIYPEGVGCPKGGEDTITVTGHYNPKFIPADSKVYYYRQLKQATVDLCKAMKTDLKQTTVSLSFHLIDGFVYLTDKEA